jgi:sulfur relay (sulfurtransferase) complex TusBCD TusD component (DsrE family)
MKIAMVISQTNPELVFNAFRLANFSRKEGDEVKMFLLAEGVELDGINNIKFDVQGQAESFLGAGGQILACGTCLKLRNSQGSELCPLSTMKDLYTLVREADRVVTF